MLQCEQTLNIQQQTFLYLCIHILHTSSDVIKNFVFKDKDKDMEPEDEDKDLQKQQSQGREQGQKLRAKDKDKDTALCPQDTSKMRTSPREHITAH